MMECLLIRESTPFFILHTDFWRKPCNYKVKNTRGEMMEAPVSKEKQNSKISKSFLFWILLLSLLFLFKSFVLQIIGVLLLVAFVCLGFYFLWHLLFRIFALIIVIGSVICAIGILAYILSLLS